MCGINLVLNGLDGATAIQKMMEATVHRGPDHSAWYAIDDRIFVAGNRLKTLDLSEAANQPVVLKDGSATLVWNGALYNLEALRNQLLDEGVQFESRADAEVLIQWLKSQGEKGIQRLEGMYALIFIDHRKKKIIVARDPYGKKPLYYHHHKDRWLFSSEARGIIASGLVERQFNTSQYLPYFYSRHTFPDQSFFEGVKQVMPGEIYSIDFSGSILSKTTYTFDQTPQPLPDLNSFKEMAVDAVLKNFHADVPVGLILSGGVDSTLLLQAWYQETGQPLHTFTAVFAAPYQSKYNDPSYAAQVAKKYRCAHHEILITPELVLQHWDSYMSSLDQHVGDSASFLTWMIAKEAKQHVKILISGAGADELFSGYDRHQAFKWYLRHRNKLRFLSQQDWVHRMLPRRVKKLLKAVAETPEVSYLNFSSLQTITVSEQTAFLSYFPSVFPPYKAALLWERSYYLVNDILIIHDNATMAHGVEGRAPYLDKALVTLSHCMTEAQHLTMEGKFWMKQLLKREGWASIASRKKLGFGLPLEEWLQEDTAFSKEVLATVKSFGESAGGEFPDEMSNLARQPHEQKREAFLQIWNLFVLASWKSYQGL